MGIPQGSGVGPLMINVNQIFINQIYGKDCEVAAGFETVNGLYWRVNNG